MDERDWALLNEEEFDEAVKNGVPEPPPEVVRGVTPWRKATNRVLVGMALGAITLNFFCLQYILPFVGAILLLLGFRTLRRENGCFKACWCIVILRLALLMPDLAMNATLYRAEFADSAFAHVLIAANIGLLFAQIFCLWGGFRAVRRKAGLPARAGGVIALALWYVLILLLGLMQLGGGLLLWALIVGAYCLILRSLRRLSHGLDEAGYAVQAAPVWVTDRALAACVTAVLAVGVGVGKLFFSSYPMEWTRAEPAGQEGAAVAAQLEGLGFPREILDDLSAEDLLACGGAQQVLVQVEDYPVNPGRRVTERQADGLYTQRVYDVEELRMTGVAVKLPGEGGHWRVFHHFRWMVDPGFHGTEAIQLWPAYRETKGWNLEGGWTGRVLYDKDGATHTAPYHTLGSETYRRDTVFWGEQTDTDVFAAFSLPNQGENCRGYVSYGISQREEGWIVDSWANYIHQRAWLKYPVQTARDYRMNGGWSDDGFVLVQDAIQFNFTKSGEPHLLE